MLDLKPPHPSSTCQPNVVCRATLCQLSECELRLDTSEVPDADNSRRQSLRIDKRAPGRTGKT
jgi:hypothetical protein